MLPAASGPQIVKLELGGQNSFHGRSRSRGASNRKVGIGALSWVHAALFKLGSKTSQTLGMAEASTKMTESRLCFCQGLVTAR